MIYLKPNQELKSLRPLCYVVKLYSDSQDTKDNLIY